MDPQNDSDSTVKQGIQLPEGNLSVYINIISRYRRMICYMVVASLVVSAIISLMLPKMYMATARILPPLDDSTGLASLLSGSDDPFMALAGSISGKQASAALYLGIMKSRSVADAIDLKFKLKKIYGVKYSEDVYSKLADRSIIEYSKEDQLINISVMDRDPRRAADMANAYVDILGKISQRLNTTQGKRKRLFLEDRLLAVRSDLEKAELNLKAFQEKHHLVSIEEQAKAVIEKAAEIRGRIMAAQTELEVFKQFGTEKQVESVMLRAKIEGLQKQLHAIEQGRNPKTRESDPSEEKGSAFFIPVNDLPHLGMELMRLTRETKVQEKLFELLSAQYEMAQIEEAKDVDTIQVVDVAVVPQKKSSPNRFIIVATSTMLGFLVAVLLSFLVEYFDFNPREWFNCARSYSKI